ncbi:MAG: nucleotide exchange factor GrpE [Thermodesulfovibrionales bacterium]
MSEEQIVSREDESLLKEEETTEKAPVAEREQLLAELQEINAKYLRLYAEFDNYKKRVSKDKEELIKYGNESLLYEILPFIDHLEMALKHASNEVSSGLVQGVEITLRELKKTLEKFGLTAIEAEGKPFDPVVHHAMSQVERNDTEDNTVVEDFRRGYMLRDKVLRPALVAVSKKTVKSEGQEEETEINKNIEEEY